MQGKVFLQLRGIGPKKAQRLAEAGFTTLEAIAHAPLDALKAVRGIGKQRALDLKEQVQTIVASQSSSTILSIQDKSKPQKIPSEATALLLQANHKNGFRHETRDAKRPTLSVLDISSSSGAVAAVLVVTLLLLGGVSGGILTYWALNDELNELDQRYDALQQQIDTLKPVYTNITYLFDNTSLATLYQQVKPSIVVIHGYMTQETVFGTQYSETQGSGFIYRQNGQYVVVTNYHVVSHAVNITVTLSNGSAYAADVIGSDPYADLAILEIKEGPSTLVFLPMVSSTTLNVGDPVVAIGTPLGLTGTMTTGIVSQLGRTIRESAAGAFAIANIIQISTPINPGNSGGPLLNFNGEVVGITTAILSDSEGLGFAIPSSTVLRELPLLVSTGVYTNHAWLGITGIDMSYEIAHAMYTNITYGWLVAEVVADGPSDQAGLMGSNRQVAIGGVTTAVGGDIIIAIDDQPILNGDDIMSYLATNTTPGDIIEMKVLRDNEVYSIPVHLGTRPPPPG